MKIEYSIGVDGCKAGWFFIAIDRYGHTDFGVVRRIAELWRTHRDAGRILIDIPIGLISGAGGGRLCDDAARKILKPLRHNSVFSPPCREALSARTYAEACRINTRVCRKKISMQAWGIAGKIKEVDDFLFSSPAAGNMLRETHPEICFWAMAGGIPMAHKKKSAAGEAERLDLLQRACPRSRAIFKAARERYARKDVARDDIIDALVNGVSALRLKNGSATLPEKPPRDRRGLLMEIVYGRIADPT